VTVRLTPEAEADLREIRGWYLERGASLAAEFVDSVAATLAQIERHPESFAVAHRALRRALLRQFPYCIFYLVESEGPVVVGCFHARRSPSAWQLRAGA